MKVNFKFLTFCLMIIFLVASYKSGMLATKRVPIRKTAGYTLSTPFASAELRDLQIYKNVKNNTNIPSITQGRVPAPVAGETKTINEWLRLIRTNSASAYFIVYDAAKGSSSARNYGFDETWLQNHGDNRVTVRLNSVQISRIQQNGALPTQAQINKIETLSISVAKKIELKTFLQTLLRRYTKLMVSFKATNAKGQTFDLFLAEPWPGRIVTAGTGYNVPAYTNVLKKWYVP